MKILYFSSHPNIPLNSTSGPGTHMREIIAGFRAEGHEVQTLIMGGNSEEQESSEQAPRASSPIKRLGKKLLPTVLWESIKDQRLNRYDAYCAQELRRACETFTPDIIYERGYFSMLSGVDTAKELGIFHVLEMNAPYPEEKVQMEGKGLFHHKAIAAEREQCLKTNLLLVVSSALKHYFIERTGIPENKVHITPNAVNPSYLSNILDKETARSPFHWDKNDLVFGFVGSIFPYHGVDKLIEAFALLECANKKLLIVGGGELLPQYKQRVEDLGISNQVEFTGAVPHQRVYQLISAMDIAMMADSNWYGSPVKIFEYGALGKAVIAPNTEPVLDVMINMQDGILCNNNIADILSAMSQLQEDEMLRAQLAVSWQEKVLKYHNWRVVSQNIIEQIQVLKTT